MGHEGQTEDARTDRVTRPRGGWTPSGALWIGIAAPAVFAAVLVAAAAFASGYASQKGISGEAKPATRAAEGNLTARGEVPPNDLASAPLPSSHMESGTAPVAAVAEVPDEPLGAVSATATDPTAVASSWSATPVFDPPAPGPALTPAAISVAEETESRFGIDIALEGQDWGAGEAEQTANIGAVASAFEMLPVTVTSSVVAGPHGTLAVLSNREGRTQDGWKPYGSSARSFYTNSDQGPEGYRAANEIVLATGAGTMTIAHELIHAWTFRQTAPDDYVLALLGDEMRSFMAAALWEQLGTDDEVRAAVREPWETVNALFAYVGPELIYADENGNQIGFKADNPLEAIALMGAIYYGRPAGMPLPAWTSAWAWFDASFS